jgi:flavin-dependent dehydrogenase
LSFDAIIIGGGLAAFAAAVRLRLEGMRVVVVSKKDTHDRVETLSPHAVDWLERQGIRPSHRLEQLVARWGAPLARRQLVPGARVIEHTALGALLQARAEAVGATIVPAERLAALARESGLWRLPLRDGSVSAPYIVDATGRRAAIGSRMGARRTSANELFCVYWKVRTKGGAGTWTEPTPHGWWNLTSLGTTGGLGFFSSSREIRNWRELRPERALDSLSLSPYVEGLSADAKIWACGSSLLCPSAGPGWIAVGDAAMTVQPLASAGIARTLRDVDALPKELASPLVAEQRRQREYAAYRGSLRHQYALENRWPDTAFWHALQHLGRGCEPRTR